METPFWSPFPAWRSFLPPSTRCPIPGQTMRVTTCANCLWWPSSRCSAEQQTAPKLQPSAGQRSMFSGASLNSGMRYRRMTPIPTMFRLIDPKALDAAFGRVLAQIAALLGDGDVIAIDGKALRGAHDKGQSARTLMMVSPLCRPVAPDAGNGCRRRRRRTAGGARGAWPDRARGQGGDGRCAPLQSPHGCSDRCRRRRLVPGAEGQPVKLLSDARSCFGKLAPDHLAARQDEAGHGRKGTRIGTVISAKELAAHHDFPGLGRSAGSKAAARRVASCRQKPAISRCHGRLHPRCSWQSSEVFLARAHRETLNALHWQLDVSFRDDAARNRKDNGPADIAILRRRAAGVARSNTSRGSLSIKPKRAGWSDTFLLRLSQTVSRRLSQTRLPCGSGPFRSDTTIFDRKFRNYKDSGNRIVGT